MCLGHPLKWKHSYFEGSTEGKMQKTPVEKKTQAEVVLLKEKGTKVL